ncbi:MAG: hypothetical protein WB699_00175 [Bacteroidota bacterium]
MLTRKTAMLIAIVAVFVVGTVALPSGAEAQRKPKSKTTVKKEQTEEQPEAKVERPAVQPQTGRASDALIDILKKYIGQKTNLGILKKAGREVVEFEDDNTVLTVPVTTIHSLKQVSEKDENDSTVVHLEIVLFAKD